MKKIHFIIWLIIPLILSSDELNRNDKILMDGNVLLNEYKIKKDSLAEMKNYINTQLFRHLADYLTITIKKPKIDTKELEIPYQVSLSKHELCVLFKKFNEDVLRFSESESESFHELIVESANKNRIFFSIPGEYMSSATPINITLDGNRKNCLRIERSIGWTPLYPYGVQGSIYLDASEKTISKLSEFKAEIVYLEYPDTWLPEVDFDGNLNETSEISPTKNSIPSINSKKIVSIDSFPIKDDVDYFKIVKNKKPGSTVIIGIKSGEKTVYLSKIVYDEKMYQKEKEHANNLNRIKEILRERLIYPKNALRQHIEGTATIGFYILETGHIRNLEIEHSSGFPILDEAALAVVKDSTEYFPKLEKETKISIPINFQLR